MKWLCGEHDTVPTNSTNPEKTSALLRFLSQYNDPLNYLLIGAALVALAINPDHPGDAIFIFIVLTANAFFGFWQENQAEQAMDSLEANVDFELCGHTGRLRK